MKGTGWVKNRTKREYRFPHLPVWATVLLTLCLCGCAASAGRTEAPDGGSNLETETLQPREILLQGKSARCEAEGVSVSGGLITIRAPGTYELSGSLDEGKILISTDSGRGDVTLILNGAAIFCRDGAAIEEQRAGNLIIRLPEGTENTVHSGGDRVPEPDREAEGAAILAEDALVLEGSGALNVEGFLNNGIRCKKDLALLGGRLSVQAANCGISASRGMEIRDGVIRVSAGNDGLRTGSDKTNGTAAIAVDGGVVEIRAGGDGISADGTLLLSGGQLEISTYGDPELGSSKGVKVAKEASMSGGSLTVNSTGHAFSGDESMLFSGGSLALSSGLGKGLTFEGGIRIEGNANLNVKAAGNAIETETELWIVSGNVRVSAGGDGLRAGDSGTGEGVIRIAGGTIFVSAAKDALDAKISLDIDGGSLFAAGNSARLQRFSEDSGQSVLGFTMNEAQSGRMEVCTENGTVLGTLNPDVPVTTVYFSSPGINPAKQYRLRLENSTGISPVRLP